MSEKAPVTVTSRPAGAKAPAAGAPKAPTPAAAPIKAPAAKPAPAATNKTSSDVDPDPGVQRTRRARLRISRIDPWAVMKTAFLFAIAWGIMSWIAVYVVWMVINAAGLLDAVNNIITLLLSSPSDQTPVRIEEFVDTNKVMGITALIGVINVVIMTALATIFAFLYNLSANILGGLEVTLAED